MGNNGGDCVHARGETVIQHTITVLLVSRDF